MSALPYLPYSVGPSNYSNQVDARHIPERRLFRTTMCAIAADIRGSKVIYAPISSARSNCSVQSMPKSQISVPRPSRSSTVRRDPSKRCAALSSIFVARMIDPGALKLQRLFGAVAGACCRRRKNFTELASRVVEYVGGKLFLPHCVRLAPGRRPNPGRGDNILVLSGLGPAALALDCRTCSGRHCAGMR